MQKLLLFAHSAFSDENANGITMKNLLSAWTAEEKAEFYCQAQAPDFSAAGQYFRITDIQAIKAFFGRKPRCVLRRDDAGTSQEGKSAIQQNKKILHTPLWLKKYKYNFVLKWIREYAWILAPWGRKQFWEWIAEVSPDVIVYMVGESVFLDRLVLQVSEKTGKPLVLYNGEAYRLIDLKQRRGLERAYYKKTKKQYKKLVTKAVLAVYNSGMLEREYETQYPGSPEGLVIYNSARCDVEPYRIKETVKITYFGNLGVGRSEELLRVAGVLEKVAPSLVLDIYGKATPEQAAWFASRNNIRYHGFVDAATLGEIISASDILLHVETFDPQRKQKLKYAFSTKIAQCLCSGRAFISFAPEEMASSEYLKTVPGVCLASTEASLEACLRTLIEDPDKRRQCAEQAYQTGLEQHRIQRMACRFRETVERFQK